MSTTEEHFNPYTAMWPAEPPRRAGGRPRPLTPVLIGGGTIALLAGILAGSSPGASQHTDLALGGLVVCAAAMIGGALWLIDVRAARRHAEQQAAHIMLIAALRAQRTQPPQRRRRARRRRPRGDGSHLDPRDQAWMDDMGEVWRLAQEDLRGRGDSPI